MKVEGGFENGLGSRLKQKDKGGCQRNLFSVEVCSPAIVGG